jgi:hypothetical protein
VRVSAGGNRSVRLDKAPGDVPESAQTVLPRHDGHAGTQTAVSFFFLSSTLTPTLFIPYFPSYTFSTISFFKGGL